MYRVLVVEDDDSAAGALQCCLGRYAQETGLELLVTRLGSAVAFAAEKNEADLIFMDIELPGVNGMEAARLLRAYDEETPLVFVTSLAQYAVEGYRVSALDFLVKPVRYFDFRMTMDRAVRNMRRNERRTVTVTTRDSTRVIAVEDIVFVDVIGHDLSYHLTDGSSVASHETLASVEKTLGEDSFVRVSKSCLVNMRHITRVSGDSLELADGSTVWFGRTKRKPAMAAIARFLGGGA